MLPDITPTELAAALQHPDHGLTLLDVREPAELEICVLPNVVAIPKDQVPDRLAELRPDAHYVVICRSGKRSGDVAQLLSQHGYPRVQNLAGGMLRWSDDVDPTVTKY
ncbi:MAG: rhodanese-like domain-containing protein [Fimbriimonadaceae bacterium]|nr:rhodanese-like domain-containing protein [Fimbriimonadaceae bacterium]